MGQSPGQSSSQSPGQSSGQSSGAKHAQRPGQPSGLGADLDADPDADLNAGPALQMRSAPLGSATIEPAPTLARGRAPHAGGALSAESHIAEELAEELALQHTPMPEHTFAAGANDTDDDTWTGVTAAAPAANEAAWEQALPLHGQGEQPRRPSEPRHTAAQSQRQRTPSEVRERIVLLSIALVGTAMTSMLHIQFGYGIGIAMAASATFMVVAILAHQLMLRAAEVHRLRRELSRGERANGIHPASVSDDAALPELTRHTDGTGAGSPAITMDADGPTAKAAADGTPTKNTDGSAWSLRPRTMDGAPSTDAAPISTVESDLARIERKIRELASGVNRDAASATVLATASDDDETPTDDAAVMETALREALRGNKRDARASAPGQATGQEPVFGKRNAVPDETEAGSANKAAAPATDDRSASQLETSINALKAAASSMRTHGLPQGRASAGHGSENAMKSDSQSVPERSSRADDRLAMPSFSDPFALPATVERIAGSRSSRRADVAQGSESSAAKAPAQTTTAPAAAAQPAADSAERRASAFPDIAIPATAVSLRKSTVTVPAPPARAAPQANVRGSAPSAPSPTGTDDPFDFADVIAAALPPPNPRLAAIARALEAGRMEVRLSPIVSLESHAVSHYAIDVHLVGDDGAQLTDVDRDLALGANDLLALFDVARIRRAATLAHQMVSRNKPGALLSQAAGGSLSSQTFADAVTEIGGESPAIALRLVLTFAQRDVLRFAAHDWQALADMQAFGFRFALSDVETLDANFADLASSGFLFVTASARQLIDGFGRKGTRLRPAAEACQRFAAAGLTVVATDISDPADRAKVFGFGALYGQGTLFGAPRTLPVAPWQPEGSSNGSNGHGSAAA